MKTDVDAKYQAKIILSKPETIKYKPQQITTIRLSNKSTSNIDLLSKLNQHVQFINKNVEKSKITIKKMYGLTAKHAVISETSIHRLLELLYLESNLFIYQEQHTGYSKFGLTIHPKLVPEFEKATLNQVNVAVMTYLYHMLTSSTVKMVHEYPYTDIFLSVTDKSYLMNIHFFAIYDREEYNNMDQELSYEQYLLDCITYYPMEITCIKYEQLIPKHITARTFMNNLILSDIEHKFGLILRYQQYLTDVINVDVSKTEKNDLYDYESMIIDKVLLNRFYRNLNKL